MPTIYEQTEEQKKAEQERGPIKNYFLWIRYLVKFMLNLPP
jgi:hypothetical protein